MATDLTRNPWILDASDIGALPRTIVGTLARRVWGGQPQTVSQWCQIGEATWHATDSAAGDLVILTDINNHECIRLGPSTGADFEDQVKYVDTEKFEGLIVTSLPHGIVHLHWR